MYVWEREDYVYVLHRNRIAIGDAICQFGCKGLYVHPIVIKNRSVNPTKGHIRDCIVSSELWAVSLQIGL